MKNNIFPWETDDKETEHTKNLWKGIREIVRNLVEASLFVENLVVLALANIEDISAYVGV